MIYRWKSEALITKYETFDTWREKKIGWSENDEEIFTSIFVILRLGTEQYRHDNLQTKNNFNAFTSLMSFYFKDINSV